MTIESSEEGIKFFTYGDKISKELKVFYNPEMKLNRDVSLLVAQAGFNKQIDYCDPMAATGIREARFIAKIPNRFKKIVAGDISKTAIESMKELFNYNSLNQDLLCYSHTHALDTLTKQYYDMIEIDPFGTPVPFLDVALQRIKHKGILSVTATDTAALCGTYPKTTFRRYSAKVYPTFCYDEIGLRILIAFCQREAAKHDKALDVLVSFSAKHFYRIFFRVKESRTQAYNDVVKQQYGQWDKINQTLSIESYETHNSLGKLYTGCLCDRSFVDLFDYSLLDDSKEVFKLITSLYDELDVVGYYNPHKLEKSHKFSFDCSFAKLQEELIQCGFQTSRVHNNRLGLKTNASGEELVAIMKDLV